MFLLQPDGFAFRIDTFASLAKPILVNCVFCSRITRNRKVNLTDTIKSLPKHFEMKY